MRAVVCRSPRDLALEERPEASRGAEEALIAVRRVGICGTDYHIYEGSHPYLEYPRIIGHELSGEVLEAPQGSVLTPGQRVLVNPYVSCGACIACCKGKPNCCVRIAVLGVHRDGGMCERISVPVSEPLSCRGPHFRRGGERRVPLDWRPRGRAFGPEARRPRACGRGRTHRSRRRVLRRLGWR